MTKLFLTGYEKETPKEFLTKLKKAKIKTVIDVREIPLSRKNGFSKNNLQKLLESRKIRYYHFPSLGSDYNSRKKLRIKGNNYDYLDFFQNYRRDIKKEKKAIKNVVQIISKYKNTALLCFEKETELCHRSIIASEILKKDPTVMAIPL